MGAINILAQPGYYYLYALYFDYPINNAFFGGEEYSERVRELVRVVQRLHALQQPYRKSLALRLFTERDAMARFSPDTVNEMLVQLRELVDRLGPPPGWSRGPLPGWSRGAPPARRARRERTGRPISPRGGGTAAPERPAVPYPAPPFPSRLVG